MSLQELGIIHKKIDKKLVGFINYRGEIKDIPSKLKYYFHKYKDYISGPPIAVIDYGVYSEGGKDIDICFLTTRSLVRDEIKTKFLEEVEVLSKMHQGSYDNINDIFQKLFNYFRIHGITGTSLIRLVFHKYDQDNPEDNETEIQAVLHKWDNRLEKNLNKILGEKARKEVMKDREKLFTIESSMDDRVQWIKDVIVRLDKAANDYEKYDILSSCAHDFSQKRIDKLIAIYENTEDIDKVLKEMHKDYDWHENPIRKGDIIYVRKIPYNREGYEKAITIDEKKKNYCHCPLVRNYLNNGISPTFCNCSAGWYRQQWEGILAKPVQIEILKSLIKGDDICEFAIHLPLDI